MSLFLIASSHSRTEIVSNGIDPDKMSIPASGAFVHPLENITTFYTNLHNIITEGALSEHNHGVIEGKAEKDKGKELFYDLGKTYLDKMRPSPAFCTCPQRGFAVDADEHILRNFTVAFWTLHISPFIVKRFFLFLPRDSRPP